MQIIIKCCDLCGADEANTVDLRVVQMGIYEDGVFVEHQSPIAQRLHTSKHDVCDHCLKRSLTEPILGFREETLAPKIYFEKDGKRYAEQQIQQRSDQEL